MRGRRALGHVLDLARVLAVGNAINAGHRVFGGAGGFALESLPMLYALVTTAASVVLSAFQGPRVPDSRAVRSRAAAGQIVALDVVVDKGAETESTQGFVKEELPDYMKVARVSPLH